MCSCLFQHTAVSGVSRKCGVASFNTSVSALAYYTVPSGDFSEANEVVQSRNAISVMTEQGFVLFLRHFMVVVYWTFLNIVLEFC